MTNRFPWQIFLPLIMSALLAGAIAAPAADVCPTGDCLLPDVEYQICTPTPIPVNPHKCVAGSNGLLETNSVCGYNWAPMVGPGNGYERIPMIRDWDDLILQILSQLTESVFQVILGGNSDYVMMFNEPDLPPPAGSDMASYLVVLGQAMVEALLPDTKIVSPAYSQYAYTRLETDYENFYETYGRYPRWDVIAYHCYFIDTAQPCMTVLNWMIAFADRIEADTGKRPKIWNTEFAALVTTGTAGPNWAPSVAAGSAYIDAMEAVGVDKYFWFSHCDEAMPGYICRLAEDDGTLNPLGQMYKSK